MQQRKKLKNNQHFNSKNYTDGSLFYEISGMQNGLVGLSTFYKVARFRNLKVGTYILYFTHYAFLHTNYQIVQSEMFFD